MRAFFEKSNPKSSYINPKDITDLQHPLYQAALCCALANSSTFSHLGDYQSIIDNSGNGWTIFHNFYRNFKANILKKEIYAQQIIKNSHTPILVIFSEEDAMKIMSTVKSEQIPGFMK